MQLYEQIEKSFLEHFERYGVSMDEDEDTFKFESPEPSVILSFLKQSFIKFLEDECERLKTQFQDEHPVDCIDGETPVETYGYEETHNQALSDTISHYQNMIKELHENKNTN